jgi:hypothetical protein
VKYAPSSAPVMREKIRGRSRTPATSRRASRPLRTTQILLHGSAPSEQSTDPHMSGKCFDELGKIQELSVAASQCHLQAELPSPPGNYKRVPNGLSFGAGQPSNDPWRCGGIAYLPAEPDSRSDYSAKDRTSSNNSPASEPEANQKVRYVAMNGSQLLLHGTL